jgi:hypothetical protein
MMIWQDLAELVMRSCMIMAKSYRILTMILCGIARSLERMAGLRLIELIELINNQGHATISNMVNAMNKIHKV